MKFNLSLCVVLASFSLVFATNPSLNKSRSRADIILDYGKDIIKLESHASTTWLDQLTIAHHSRQIIRANVKEARHQAAQEILELDEVVLNATEVALNKSKSIYSCKRQLEFLKLKKVHPLNFLLCESEENIKLDVIDLEMGKFFQVKAAAALIIPKCGVLHPLSNKKFELCIQDNIKYSDIHIENIKNSTMKEITTVNTEAVTCIGNTLGEIDIALQNITETFVACVDKILTIV